MRISNWESAKKQAIRKLPAFTVTVALIFIMVTFITFWNGHIDYREQTEQLDWSVTNATVSYVYKYLDNTHRKGNWSRERYDIHYDYFVNDQIYTGIIEGRIQPNKEGDTFKIKYNPQNPEESTHILEPSREYLISGTIFGTLGLAMAVATVVLVKKNQSMK